MCEFPWVSGAGAGGIAVALAVKDRIIPFELIFCPLVARFPPALRWFFGRFLDPRLLNQFAQTLQGGRVGRGTRGQLGFFLG